MDSRGYKQTLIELLLEGTVDDIYAGWVFEAVKSLCVPDDEAIRDMAIGFIADVLDRGLFTPGEFVGDDFVSWDTTTGESIARVIERWRNLDEIAPYPGSIVWLRLTAKGEELALSHS